MGIIFVLLFVLVLITLVGHGIWVLFAWLIRALAGLNAPAPGKRRESTHLPERCAGCGQLLPPRQRFCEKCGLESKSPAAGELHDLEITAQQLARLQQAGTLDSPTYEQVHRCIETRRQVLLATARPVPAPSTPEQLQQLLESCADVSRLSPDQREQALLWYRMVGDDRLASLSPAAQLALARLLRQVRRSDDSLRAYRRLLDHHPHDSAWADWAFEAGRFAAEKKITDQACEFLEKALSRAPSLEKRQQIEGLLQSLRRPVQEEIADVIPALGGMLSRPLGDLGEVHDQEGPRKHGTRSAAPRPRRSFAEVLGAFIEERNILWGELVGGLLMVGCSIALVIYLWKELERIPYFQFVVFVGTTTAVFGVGLYTRYRLKLETTSRGLFVIATLLVPLNFLVMAGLAGQRVDSQPFDLALRIAIEIVSLAIFAALMNGAAPALIPEGRWWFIVTVLGASASQLVVPRLLAPPFTKHTASFLPMIALGCLPVAFYGLGTGGYLYQLSRRRPIDRNRATALFAFLGMAAFSLIVALGFVIYWSSNLGGALERLAVLIALAGVPILAGGLLVQHRLQTAGGAEDSDGTLRTIATAVALAGMLIMLAAVVLAWPQPVAIILVCAVNFAVLTTVAFVYGEPIAHGVALPCLALGSLIGFQLLWSGLSAEDLSANLPGQLSSSSSGCALAVLALLLAVAGRVLVQAGRVEQGFGYTVGAGVAALVSLLLVNLRGLSYPGTATILTGLYAVTSLGLSLRWRRPLISYFGLALLVVTTLWALWWRHPALTPAWGTVLGFEALGMAVVAALAFGRIMPRPWRDGAALAGCLGLALALASSDSITAMAHTWTGCALVATAFVLAWCYRARALTWVGSVLLLATLLHALGWVFTDLHLAHPVAVAMLTHATLLVLGSLLLQALETMGVEQRQGGIAAGISPLARIFAQPLFQAALISSLVAFPLLFALAWGEVRPLAGYLGWLSGIWLILAWNARSPWLFAAFQAALSGTVLVTATAWLEGQAWVIDQYPAALADPRSLQTYGIALGLLGLVWLAARFALRSNAVARLLFNPPWPAVDWVVLGLLVLAQLGLAVWRALPGMLGELTPLGTTLAATGPAEHVHAHGLGAWMLLGVLAIALVAALWQREQSAAVLGLILLGVTASVLQAAAFEEDLATASSLRWAFGICFIAFSGPVWLRNPLMQFARSVFGFRGDSQNGAVLRTAAKPGTLAVLVRGLLIACTVVPVLGLTLAAVIIGWGGQPLSGPRAGSWFAEIGWPASNLVPLAMLSLGLAGHSLRERSPGYAFSAGLVVNVAVSLIVWHSHRQLAPAEWWVDLLQANVMATASVELLWLVIRKQLLGGRTLRLAPSSFLATQVGLGLAGNGVLLCSPLLWIVGQPGESLPSPLVPMGYLGGWLALGLAMAAAFWYADQVAPDKRGYVLAALGVALGILAACSANLWALPGSWVAYHVLLATWTGTGLVILAAESVAQLQDRTLSEFSPFPYLARLLAFSPREFRAWLDGIGLLVIGLAVRGAWEDPARPYWSAGATLAVSAMAGAVALRSGLGVYAHISGLLINVAGSMLWAAWGPWTPIAFAYTQVLCFGLASGIWSVLDMTFPQPCRPSDGVSRSFAFRHAALVYAPALLAGLVTWSVLGDVLAGGSEGAGLLPWAALGATVAALAISLWDHEATYNLGGFYAAGLLAIGLALHTSRLEPADLGLTAAVALAFYVLLATGLARLAPYFPGLWQELHLPSRAAAWPEAWFVPAQATVLLGSVGLSLWLALDAATLPERLVGPLAVAILLPAVALLAGGTQGRWAIDSRYTAFALGVLLVAEIGWALLGPSVANLWLHRHVLLMAALALMTLVYGIGLVRMLPEDSAWAGSARRLGPVLGACTCMILLLLLGHEALLYNLQLGRTPMLPWAIAIVAAGLAGMIAAGISFAVMPGREPLGLSERGRTLYVYAGELLLALLFVHFRLTVPELFRHHFFAQYWTFIVMAIAFLGVGLSEFFHRRGLPVLAEPLARTGVFLPLLPLLSFWVLPLAQVQPQRLFDPANYGRYAALWFLAGSLYTLLAAVRRSFRFALSAALAANFGLWALLVHSHVDFLTHPQMWLIPFALIMLVAEHLNRDRLTQQQGNTLRYAALLMIYVSSTADMFIAGLGHSVVLPLVLAVLSVLGVLSGILLRVRAFLYLGVTFLFLVIFTMIWHAAVGLHQIWIWWASGIVLGAAIIGLFAVFEKRRNDVLHMMDEIKKWS
jgi:hypothetical protein